MAYYEDYDHNNQEDDLLNLIEGRDEEADFEEYQAQKRKHEQELDADFGRPTKKQNKRNVHGVDLDDLDRLRQRVENDADGLDNFIENDMEEDDEQEPREDEAIEVPDKKKASTTPRIRRVIKNPRPKLNEDTLKSRRGLIALRDAQKTLVMQGKGHELSDLNKIMFTLEHWAHRLHPHMSFDDFLDRTAKLGSKRQIGVYMHKLRCDLPLEITGELVQSDQEEAFDPNAEEDQFMEFDAPDPDVARLTSEQAFDQIFGDTNDNHQPTTTTITKPAAPSAAPSLTEEQRELIARKRLEALAKRQKALEQNQNADVAADSSNVPSEPVPEPAPETNERANSPAEEENLSEDEFLRQLNANDDPMDE